MQDVQAFLCHVFHAIFIYSWDCGSQAAPGLKITSYHIWQWKNHLVGSFSHTPCQALTVALFFQAVQMLQHALLSTHSLQMSSLTDWDLNIWYVFFILLKQCKQQKPDRHISRQPCEKWHGIWKDGYCWILNICNKRNTLSVEYSVFLGCVWYQWIIWCYASAKITCRCTSNSLKWMKITECSLHHLLNLFLKVSDVVETGLDALYNNWVRIENRLALNM